MSEAIDSTPGQKRRAVRATREAMEELLHRDDPRPASFVILRVGTDTGRLGIKDGTVFHPPSPCTDGEADLAEENLGKPATVPGEQEEEEEIVDAEVWEPHELSPDLRIGHHIGYTKEGKPIYVVAGGGDGNVVHFDLVQDGGSAGSNIAYPTFTYTVYRRGAAQIPENVLGTGIGLTGFGLRWLMATYTAASLGLGYMNAGVPVLTLAFERPASQFDCDPEE